MSSSVTWDLSARPRTFVRGGTKRHNGVNKLKTPETASIVITHYQRLLDFIVPDFVHVLYKGRIVKSGTKELALELEERGYEWIAEELTAE